MNRFTKMTDRLKEIILASRLATQPPVDKQSTPTPQEPEE
jgi:hypothetical protein